MGHDVAKNSDGFIIRQNAIQQNIPLITSLDTATSTINRFGKSFIYNNELKIEKS